MTTRQEVRLNTSRSRLNGLLLYFGLALALAGASCAGGLVTQPPVAPNGGHETRSATGQTIGLVSSSTSQVGGGHASAEKSSLLGPTVVGMSASLYHPAEAIVLVGTTVRWDNAEAVPHTVSAPDGSFESGLMFQGVSWSLTFEQPGVFEYVCKLHPFMVGRVTALTSMALVSEQPSFVAAPAAPASRPGQKITPAPNASPDVTMGVATFGPVSLTADAGKTVVWLNTSDVPHTVTASDGSYDSSLMMPGARYTRTYSAAGTYDYVCILHPGMVGTITVVGNSPPPASSGHSAASPSTSPDQTTTPANTPSPSTAPVFAPAPLATPTPVPTPVAAPAPVQVPTVEVTMGQADFAPGSLAVRAGHTVVWRNTSALPHMVAASGMFDSGLLMPGGTYSYAFSATGTYSYTCILHPGMVGTVTVLDAVATAPVDASPAPAPTAAPSAETPASSPALAPEPTELPAPTVVPSSGTSPAPAATPTPTAVPSPTPAPAPAPAPAPTGDVTMSASSFSPASLTVSVGRTVVWANTSSLPHTLAASDGSFDAGLLMPGAAYSRAFAEPGTVNYTCIVHPGMVGSITVVAAAAPPTADAPATATPTPTPTPVVTPTPTPPPAPMPSPSGDVAMGASSFSPATLTVSAGRTVVWANTSSLPHTVTASGAFDSGMLMPGATYSYAFSSPGTYSYTCILHPGMAGTVTVTGGASGPGPATTPTPTPTPSPTPVPAPAPTGDVSMGTSSFSPAGLTVGAGKTVVWANTSSLPHTVTASGAFDSGILMPGATYSYTFSNAGTYSYTCILHPGMTGTVTVAGGVSGPAITPTPTPPPPPTPAPGPTPTPTPTPAPGSTGDVTMGQSSFSPASLTVNAGYTVMWSNSSSLPHTVTASGAFDSGILMPGATYSYTFSSPGTYSYTCILHSGMVGTVTVAGGAPGPGPAPTPAPTPVPTPTPAPTPAPAPGLVRALAMGDDYFSPTTAAVEPGTTVTWTNSGRSDHTVTSTGGAFNSGTVRPGQSYSTTLNTPGTYRYVCAFHSGMAGTITVSQGMVSPPPGGGPVPPPVVSPPPVPTQAQVSFLGLEQAPVTTTIAAGGRVTWVNNDTTRHRVRYQDPRSSRLDFDSDNLDPGEVWSWTFTAPGTYTYECHRHSNLGGTVVVVPSGQAAPVPTPTQPPVPVPTPFPSPTPAPSPAPAPGAVAVTIGDDFFSPTSVTVTAGATVTWTNAGRSEHTVTFATGGYNSGNMAPGATYSVTLSTPATYSYVCAYHSKMTGRITVQ